MKKFFLISLCLAIVVSCGTQRKVRRLREGRVEADIRLSDRYASDLPELHVDRERRDTLHVVDLEGRQTLLMNAVKDEDGEMVATDVIQAAVVTARFRNIAERHGQVDLRFEVHVPPEMQDSRWQLCFYPDLYVLGDSTRLDPVVITGEAYRKAQLRGYERYQRFLDGIITDSSRFLRKRELEIFLARNIPALYDLRDEERYVSDEEFASIFGVSERDAVAHYTSQWRIRRNEARKARIDKMYRRYVKAPLVTEGLRLDTVITGRDGAFIYEYVQTLRTRPHLKKADIVLSGEILEEGRRVYGVPRSPALTFYISSLSAFVDPTERYLTQVVQRRVEENSACWIDFRAGRWEVDPDLSHNRTEIGRIRRNLVSLLRNVDFDMDSITVTASCSPEGTYATNTQLSARRAKSVSDYFQRYVRHCRDSLRRADGFHISLDGTFRPEAPPAITFISRGQAENWTMLERLVAQDTVLTAADKAAFAEAMSIADPDARETALRKRSSHRRLREVLYPRLRTVEFGFYLHRKGMVQDTVHTTVLDTVYRDGVQALRDRDYPRAVTLLRPYADFNTALAYCAMDYDQSALAVLERLPDTAETAYLKAILYSREGDDQMAVQHYLQAVQRNSGYIFRGNLDPEISVLIKKYGLHPESSDHETL